MSSNRASSRHVRSREISANASASPRTRTSAPACRVERRGIRGTVFPRMVRRMLQLHLTVRRMMARGIKIGSHTIADQLMSMDGRVCAGL